MVYPGTNVQLWLSMEENWRFQNKWWWWLSWNVKLFDYGRLSEIADLVWTVGTQDYIKMGSLMRNEFVFVILKRRGSFIIIFIKVIWCPSPASHTTSMRHQVFFDELRQILSVSNEPLESQHWSLRNAAVNQMGTGLLILDVVILGSVA